MTSPILYTSSVPKYNRIFGDKLKSTKLFNITHKNVYSRVDLNSLPHTPTFLNMYYVIHVDEKWFYITLVDRTFYLCNDEDIPVRAVKHKSHLQKIMFITAVARPRFQDSACAFDGKIGIWPFLEEVPAKKASKNRPKGTIELKPVLKILQSLCIVT